MQVTSALSQQLAKNPLLVLGGALGAGYLVGGGLASPITARLLKAGGGLAFRLMVLPALQEVLRGVVAARTGGVLLTDED